MIILRKDILMLMGAMVEFFKEIGLDVIVQYWDQVEPKWYE